MALTTAQLDFASKKYYSAPKVDTLALKPSKTLGIINHPILDGGTVVVPVIYSGLATGSADFNTAIALSGTNSVNGVQFEFKPKAFYNPCQVPGQSLRGAGDNKNKYFNVAKIQMDAAMQRFGVQNGYFLFGNGRGMLAAGTFTTDTVTFADAAAVAVIEKGDQLVCALSETAALKNAGTAATVLAVNRSAKTVQFTQNVATAIAGATTGDTFFFKGCRPAAAITLASQHLVINGFGAHIPRIAPLAGDQFGGVDRSVDSRLYGNVVSGLGKSKVDALIDAVSSIMGASSVARPDKAILSIANFSTLLKDCESTKVRYEPTKIAANSEAGLSYSGIVLHSPLGDIEVMADMFLSDNDGWVLQSDTWDFWSLGEKAPGPVNHNGQIWLSDTSFDGISSKVGGYVELTCSNQAANCRITYDV